MKKYLKETFKLQKLVIFRFYNSKEAVMNFAKYLVAHIFAKQIIF